VDIARTPCGSLIDYAFAIMLETATLQGSPCWTAERIRILVINEAAPVEQIAITLVVRRAVSRNVRHHADGFTLLNLFTA
jgi:hypothetical protein